MKRISEKGVKRYLKDKHNLAIGGLTAERILSELKTRLDAPIKIEGRSYATGLKKQVKVTLGSLLSGV